MLLYHFTAPEYIEQIKAEGLTRGDVPTSSTEGINAVWLTSDRSPDGHGLSDGQVLTDQERDIMERLKGQRRILQRTWASSSMGSRLFGAKLARPF